jgi:hypothetical protein
VLPRRIFAVLTAAKGVTSLAVLPGFAFLATGFTATLLTWALPGFGLAGALANASVTSELARQLASPSRMNLRPKHQREFSSLINHLPLVRLKTSVLLVELDSPGRLVVLAEYDSRLVAIDRDFRLIVGY